jgi:trigger factor
VNATLEPLDDNKVKLSVEVDEVDFEEALDRAFKRLAREVRIPGFRPGKAPRKLLEAHLGSGYAREEAMRQELPQYYAAALRDHDVDAIAAPELDVTSGAESGPVHFDAVVEVRPRVSITGYADLEVAIESPVVDDAEIQDQIDRLRQPFAELEPVDRPSIEGDNLTVDIVGKADGEEAEGLTTDDYLYEVGSGSFLPEFDDQLTGVKVGDIVDFGAAHPDPDEDAALEFRVLVKEVKEKILPDVDDEWAEEASEFDTVDELRADLVRRMSATRVVQAQMAFRQSTAEALAGLVDIDVPEAMVEGELQQRLQDLAMRLDAQGMDIEQYLAATGADRDQLFAELRASAEVAARVDLALRAVVEAEGVEIDDDELAEELVGIGERVGQDPDEVEATLRESDQMGAVRSDLVKNKALEWLLDQVTVVDTDGEVIDPELLVVPPDAETDDGADDDETTAEDNATDHEDSGVTE